MATLENKVIDSFALNKAGFNQPAKGSKEFMTLLDFGMGRWGMYEMNVYISLFSL